jgi:hypothetical protein
MRVITAIALGESLAFVGSSYGVAHPLQPVSTQINDTAPATSTLTTVASGNVQIGSTVWDTVITLT